MPAQTSANVAQFDTVRAVDHNTCVADIAALIGLVSKTVFTGAGTLTIASSGFNIVNKASPARTTVNVTASEGPIIVADGKGDAQLNPIDIQINGGAGTINGQTTFTIAGPYVSVTLTLISGTAWLAY